MIKIRVEVYRIVSLGWFSLSFYAFIKLVQCKVVDRIGMYNSVTMPKSSIEDFKQRGLISRKVRDKKPAGESKAVPISY